MQSLPGERRPPLQPQVEDTKPYVPDEFSMLPENAAELGMVPGSLPPLRRVAHRTSDGLQLSAIAWGSSRPELVVLHGGGQNAHTWDSALLALGRAALAIDLPGHGHSDWRDDHDYSPWTTAAAVAEVMEALAPSTHAVVANAFGGLVAIALASDRTDLVRKLVLVDVSPSVAETTAALTTEQIGTSALTRERIAFGSFDAMVAVAVKASPTRSERAVTRGVRHNSRQLEDGRWVWRYDRLDGITASRPLSMLLENTAAIAADTLLVRGGLSRFVSDTDVQQMRNRLPGMRDAVIAGAGHNVQSDRPAELAAVVDQFLAR